LIIIYQDRNHFPKIDKVSVFRLNKPIPIFKISAIKQTDFLLLQIQKNHNHEVVV